MKFIRFVPRPLVLCLLVGVVAWSVAVLCRQAEVTFEVRTPVSGSLEVFWRNSGQDYAQSRSHAVRVPSTDRFQRITINLPSPWVDDIRLDPLDKQQTVTFRTIEIRRGLSTITLRGQELANALQPLHQVRALSVSGSEVSVVAEGADPQVSLRLSGWGMAFWFYVSVLAAGATIGFLLYALCSVGGRIQDSPWFAAPSRTMLHRSFLVFFLGLFVFLVAFRIHGSSLHAWYDHVPSLFKTHEKPLLGEPRGIRSDEWLVQTPGIISEALLSQPFEWPNPTIGADAAPMLMGLPTRHPTTVLRPQYWGFFLFDLEHGFSWFWSYRVVSCLVGVYLLLYCLTRGHPVLSMVGSLWCFYSPFVQWWLSATVPELIGNLTLGLYATVCLLTAPSIGGMCLSALGIVLFGVSFALQLYPPFQIPLMWCALALLGTALSSVISLDRFRDRVRLRLGTLLVAFLASVVAIASYLYSARHALSILSHTAYPGARSLSGGGFELARYFNGFGSILMGEGSFPDSLGNMCEASSFLMVWPLVFVCFLFGRSGGKLGGQTPLVLYLLAMSSYVLLGWPPLLAKLTFLNLVPSGRAILGIGLANVCFTIIYLAGDGAVSKVGRLSGMWALTAGALGWCSLMRVAYGDFFGIPQLAVSVCVLLALSLPLILKRRGAFGFAVVALTLAASAGVNPVAQGLRPLLNNRVTDAVRALPGRLQTEPVLVFGGFVVPQLFEASGLQVITGSKFVPDLAFWGKIDPTGAYVDIYNRYAHVVFQPAMELSISDMVVNQPDLITVTSAPCGVDLERAGVNFMVLPRAYAALDLSCLHRIPSDLDTSGFEFYVRKSAASRLLAPS